MSIQSTYFNAVDMIVREHREQRDRLMTPGQFYLSLQTENVNRIMKSSGSYSSFFSSETKRLKLSTICRATALAL